MKPRRDQRLTGLVIAIVAIGILGSLITLMPNPQPHPVASVAEPAIDDGKTSLSQHLTDARGREVEMRFQQAISMLHAKQFEYAVKALYRVLELSPRLVEAHVNMGYALIGLKDYKTAYDFFQNATELRPEQVNAYYGMAVALEGLGELEGALGAMRTFIHLSKGDSPFLVKARAALWEWQDKLEKQREASPQSSTETIPEQHG